MTTKRIGATRKRSKAIPEFSRRAQHEAQHRTHLDHPCRQPDPAAGADRVSARAAGAPAGGRSGVRRMPRLICRRNRAPAGRSRRRRGQRRRVRQDHQLVAICAGAALRLRAAADDGGGAAAGRARTADRMLVAAGSLVQPDAARTAVTYDRMVPPASFADYRHWVGRYVEVLNHALEGIPQDRVRYHVCWGSWPGPHTTDGPLRDIVDLILQVRAGAYVIEGANPRHEHGL